MCICVHGLHVGWLFLARIEKIEGGKSPYPCWACSHNHEGKGVSDLLL